MNKFKTLLMLIVLLFISNDMNAQVTSLASSIDVNNLQSMQWVCPDVERYQSLLSSYHDEDIRIYSANAKQTFGLFPNASNPNESLILSGTRFVVNNSLYKKENLINHIGSWLKKKNSLWSKNLQVDMQNGVVYSSAEIIIAEHAAMLENHRITLYPSLFIKQMSADTLFVILQASRYKDEELGRGNVVGLSKTVKIADSYPFNETAKYKQTYAKAHIGSYQYFWKFISQLQNELNTNFTQDALYVAELRNQHYKDSLMHKYGQPTKIISCTKSSYINNDIYIYGEKQKLVYGGQTLDFRDIMSCELKDDPKFIPGKQTTAGAGITIFGIELGGSQTYTTPGKTLHKYMVNVKIDSLSSPLVIFYFGEDEKSANELLASLEYIIRHKNDK